MIPCFVRSVVLTSGSTIFKSCLDGGTISFQITSAMGVYVAQGHNPEIMVFQSRTSPFL